MSRYRSLGLVSLSVATLGLLLMVGPAQAHVLLHEPNGGEQLEVGSTFTITWEILATHFLMDWDLWYSTESSTGPWVTIVMNEVPGSPAVGSIHTYEWTIPDVVDDSVWVRVKMDNIGDTDYYDVSDLSFSIVPPAAPGSGDVGEQLQVAKQETDIVLSWGASCSELDTDFSVYEGTLGAFTSHMPVFCSTGGNPESGPFIPVGGNRYFLVVPRQATQEGSYGTDSEGAQRSASVSRCHPPAPLSCP
jgi:hypothetical protein